MLSARVTCIAAACFVFGLAGVRADDGTGNEACAITTADVEVCDEQDAVLPDLMTVVPKHLGIQNRQQKEILRFSNGIANLGFGPWWLEPGFPDSSDTDTCQNAYQLLPTDEQFNDRKILAGSTEVPAPIGTYSSRCQKGKFDFHETHNHWHIANVGSFKICRYEDFVSGKGKSSIDSGCPPAELPETGHAIGVKFTFCLIDWYKLGDNSPTSDDTRNFWDCATGFQGITPQWVDQYHHATEGQDIEISGLPAGRYVLVSTVNENLFRKPLFQEMDTGNNTSWAVFDLLRESEGNLQLVVVEDACSSNYNYVREQLEPAVVKFVERFHGGSSWMEQKILDDMCGGKTVNR